MCGIYHALQELNSLWQLAYLSFHCERLCVADCVKLTGLCALLQDTMLTRVETARQEMQHIGDFDYGELPPVVISKASCEAYARCMPE